MEGIRNIIFDFGNVLFDLNLPGIRQGFVDLLGETAAAAAWERLQRERIYEAYEVGEIGTEAFLEAVRETAAPLLTRDQVVDIWNSIFIGVPVYRLGMLLALRKRYRLFLLSNINEMHERYVDDYMLREHGISDFRGQFFDGSYYSHLIRLRKPDKEAYEYVLADAQLNPDQTVFIDDLEENVEAARVLGIHGIHKPAEEEVLHLMTPFLML